MQEQKENPVRVLLVGLWTDETQTAFDRSMEELERLAETCGMEVAHRLTQRAKTPVKATYIGPGKLEEAKEWADAEEVSAVIFDNTLSPMQFRNLQKALTAEVIDRTGLILRIFSENARTREARLQVEHARLVYTLPRLAGMWTHFGRQGGGASSGGGGATNRGAGETQLEMDRRAIARRLAALEKELSQIEKERATQREKRGESAVPKVALVGYTNAGKSTLMNAMLSFSTHPGAERTVEERDALFATLDTTVRRIAQKDRRPFLLSDTVGFIDELPTSLVKAFRSTLEEACYADLLLLVTDASDWASEDCLDTTRRTLAEIGAGAIPSLVVYNKIDLCEDEDRSRLRSQEDAVFISAKRPEDVSLLLERIQRCLEAESSAVELYLPYREGKLFSMLSENRRVLESAYEENGIRLRAMLTPAQKKELSRFRMADGASEADGV